MVTPCPVGKFEAAIAQCGFDSFPAFFDGVVRQTDYIEVLHVGGTDVHFDFDEVGIDAKHSGAERFEEHEGGSCLSAAQDKLIE